MARIVRVASVAMAGSGGSIEANREIICRRVERALQGKPDIICLPETFPTAGIEFDDIRSVAESVPGPTVDLMADYARRNRCYIICPLLAKHGDVVMNDAVLIDRQGSVEGVYSKVHPVVQGSEYKRLERGVTPGREIKVFDTDLGRIGMQICFDIEWDGSWRLLKEQGAEIVFWCSAFDGCKRLGFHAWNQHYYVVSGVKSQHACVHDIMGNRLAMTSRLEPVAVQAINLDVGIYHTDFNAPQIEAIRARYGFDVTIVLWRDEGVFSLSADREGLSIEEINAEFGLEPLGEYLARNERLQAAIRDGRPVPDLTPPYLGREQWV